MAECYNKSIMKALQTLLILMFSILLLVTLWPLFVFLVVIMSIYWIIIKNRIQKAASDIHEMNENQTQQSTRNKDAIDAEIVDEREL